MKGNDFLDYAGLEKYHDRLTSVLEDKFTWVKNYVDREINNIPEPEIPEQEPVLNVDRIKYESVDGSLIQPNNTSFGDSYYIDSEDYGYIYYGGPITEIPSGAFFDNTNLQKLYIPVGVTRIGNNAFSGCYALTDVTIPEGVSDIGTVAFYNTSLETVTIPNSVTYIAQGAFQKCQSLKYVTLSESLSDINQQAFAGCSSLTSIIIPNSVTRIGSEAFKGCSSLTSVTIPNSVTSIEGGAFRYCSSLTSVTIPNSVTSIGESAFKYCTSLTSITCLGTTPPTLGSDTLPDSITYIFVPKQTVDQYKTNPSWSQYSDKIFPIEDDLSENTVNYQEFNNKMYSLKLGYDSNNKLEIQVVKDLAYALTLSASPTSVWYGSGPTITFTVRANDYTKGAAGWTFKGNGFDSSYTALGPNAQQKFTTSYTDITTDVPGTLTLGEKTSTITVWCRKPIICSTSDISDDATFTDFTNNAGFADLSGTLAFSEYIPSTTPLYIGVPGNKDYIKYKSGTSDNESPRSKTANIYINGQQLSYSIFECSVTTGAAFKIYE